VCWQAGHDISDGGVLVAALEMAFAGNRGFDINLNLKEVGG
jgi:phosphoribosylformylglycinamidine synthase